MKWHDARTEKPQRWKGVYVKGQIEAGIVWLNHEEGELRWRWETESTFEGYVKDFPFYATVEEVEKELGS